MDFSKMMCLFVLLYRGVLFMPVGHSNHEIVTCGRYVNRIVFSCATVVGRHLLRSVLLL